MVLPDLDPASWIDRQICRSTFQTLRMLSSFRGLITGTSDAIAASNFAAMLDVDVIVAAVGSTLAR